MIIHDTESVAIYGLSTETERFLQEKPDGMRVIGLLDSYRTEGELYGYSIISLQQAADAHIQRIIVVARPGSCKAIAKKIGGFCKENNILLTDANGTDLTKKKEALYSLPDLPFERQAVLSQKIAEADAVSFDLFHTLVMRKVMSYTDVFDLVQIALQKKGIQIDGFTGFRIAAEKRLSISDAPTLTEIYESLLAEVDCEEISADELARLEWEIDLRTIIARDAVCELFRRAVRDGKRICIVSDSYYRREQIAEILRLNGLTGYEELFVSCEHGKAKTQGLFQVYRESIQAEKYLHIGDDDAADIRPAQALGMDTFRLCNAEGLMDAVASLGLEEKEVSLCDRIKTGLLVSKLFNDPFLFDAGDRGIPVQSAYDIGYVICAPMICDFVLWMDSRMWEEGVHTLWFGARDGYLLQKMYELSDCHLPVAYILTSRTAAIRAGMESIEDIAYVNSMKFSGSLAEQMETRFGIPVPKDCSAEASDDSSTTREKHHGSSTQQREGLLGYKEEILHHARMLRSHYRTYLQHLEGGTTDTSQEKTAFFDFVAKGTTQMYLEKIAGRKLNGFYFLQLEPEYMKDKGLAIEPFYTETEREHSAIFDLYYILETILTAPHPQVLEFTKEGEPVYAKETRTEKDIACVMRVQEGILDYFRDYVSMLPASHRQINKPYDETVLALVSRLSLKDADFLSLTIEDPFFNRMTPLEDVIH